MARGFCTGPVVMVITSLLCNHGLGLCKSTVAVTVLLTVVRAWGLFTVEVVSDTVVVMVITP